MGRGDRERVQAPLRVGFAGAGNMAAAMARGWAGSGTRPSAMLFSDRGSGRAEALAAEVGGEAVSLSDLAGTADLVVLAVKPADLDPTAGGMGNTAPTLVSLLGGTSLARVAEAFPGVPAVRVMPNVACEVRQGVLCWTAGSAVEKPLRDSVVELLGGLGLTIEVGEHQMDGATAVMACSPAYLALFAEALADAGVREGLEGRQAQRMVVETFAGTAGLLRDRDPLDVRRMVTSPGGSTAAGLAALERGGVRAVLAEAVRDSIARMRG
jgi:pyrroline-5-carboxylate reductase